MTRCLVRHSFMKTAKSDRRPEQSDAGFVRRLHLRRVPVSRQRFRPIPLHLKQRGRIVFVEMALQFAVAGWFEIP